MSARTQLDPRIAELLQQYGEDPSDRKGVIWDCHGTWVVYHRAVERVAARAGIGFDPPQIIRSERDEAVILVTGRMGERVDWDIGEALIGVNYRVSGKQAAYVYAMALKRARDRVILKLVGLHGLLYSEEEADEFRQGGSDSAPRKGGATAANDAGDEPDADLIGLAEGIGEDIEACKTHEAVADLMLQPATQRVMAALPDKQRNALRDHAKSRMVTLGWSRAKASAPKGRR